MEKTGGKKTKQNFANKRGVFMDASSKPPPLAYISRW